MNDGVFASTAGGSSCTSRICVELGLVMVPSQSPEPTARTLTVNCQCLPSSSSGKDFLQLWPCKCMG